MCLVAVPSRDSDGTPNSGLVSFHMADFEMVSGTALGAKELFSECDCISPLMAAELKNPFAISRQCETQHLRASGNHLR
jgi:hypothetical protein